MSPFSYNRGSGLNWSTLINPLWPEANAINAKAMLANMCSKMQTMLAAYG